MARGQAQPRTERLRMGPLPQIQADFGENGLYGAGIQARDGDQIHPRQLIQHAAGVVERSVLITGAVFVRPVQRRQLIRPYRHDRLKPPFDFGVALAHLLGVGVMQGQGLSEREHMLGLIMAGQRLGDVLGAARRGDRGAGVGMMPSPLKIARTFRKLTSALKVPVTGKIRLGWDRDKNYKLIARVVEENGGSLIAVHGRTKEQRYSGNADWDAIAEVKSLVKIPVTGSGDVRTVVDIQRMKGHTNCDAVMIGRGAMRGM